jgi:hypothetical protein
VAGQPAAPTFVTDVGQKQAIAARRAARLKPEATSLLGGLILVHRVVEALQRRTVLREVPLR